MPDDSLNDAVKEASASTDIRFALLKAIEITHPVGGDFFLLANKEPLTLTHEDGTSHDYEAVAFNLQRPKQGETGTQELALTIDNSDQRITDFIDTVKNSQTPTLLKSRSWLENDLTTPVSSSALELTIVKVSLGVVSVTIRARFVEVLNRPFPNQLYTRDRFPSLGG